MSQLKISRSLSRHWVALGTLVFAASASAVACGGGDGGTNDADSGGDSSGGNNAGGAGADGSGGDGAGNSSGGGTTTPGFESLGCETRDGGEATKVSGVITSDATWSGLIYLDGDVEIEGAKITIARGTEVVAAKGSSLTVSDGGTLLVAGEELEPVRFCGEEDVAGSWRGLTLTDTASAESEFNYVLVSDAGATEQAVLLNAAALINNFRVEKSGSVGVRAAAFAKGSTGLSVTGAKEAPVVLSDAAAVSPFPTGGTLTGNGDDTVHLRFFEFIIDADFQKLDVPYAVKQGLWGNSGIEFIIRPGAKFIVSADMEVSCGKKSLCQFEGTAEEPIVFEGEKDERGFWPGVGIGNDVLLDSKLEHISVRNCGNALSVSAQIVVGNIFAANVERGFRFKKGAPATGSKNLSIDGATFGAFFVDLDSLCKLPLSGSYVNIDEPYVQIDSGTFSDTCSLGDIGAVYRFRQTKILGELEILAGQTVAIYDDGAITVGEGGRLSFVGTKENPIDVGGLLPPTSPHGGITYEALSDGTSSIQWVNFLGESNCLTLHQPIAVSNADFSACGTAAFRADTTTYDSLEYTSKLTNITPGTLPVYYTP